LTQNALVLVYEREQDCLARLLAEGITPARAEEIASYLAQSTDLAAEFSEIEAECSDVDIRFEPVTLDEFAVDRRRFDPARSLVWTLTDGVAYFAGSVAPSLARLEGFKRIGAEDALFALCQDKFRSGAVLQALGIQTPTTVLARDGVLLSSPIPDAASYFVKPNRLGAKIGIYDTSHCSSFSEALDLSRRVFAEFGDAVVIQGYVPGVNVRASWLDLDGSEDMDRLGIVRVDSQSDFQTMADSMALYGETGEAAKEAGLYSEPSLVDLSVENPRAANRIKEVAAVLMRGLGLKDVFSLDFRVGPEGAVTLLEFEVCPGLPCFDFRTYVRQQWQRSLPSAMAATAQRHLKT
jgi:D-alanine-D-alanine ligase-like ATP-grasp enzyme